MAGFDSSPSDSEYGFSKPHLIGLACLGTGLAVVLALSSFTEPEQNRFPETASLAENSPEKEPPVHRAILKKPWVARKNTPRRSPFLPTPAIAERRTPSQPSRDVPPPQLVAALAEKPPEPESEINLHPNWNHLASYELEADLLKRVPEIGLDLKQAEEVIVEVAKNQRKETTITGPDPNVLALLDETHIQGLPFQTNSECKLSQAAGSALQRYSRVLHRTISRSDPGSTRRGGPSFSSVSFSHQAQQQSKLIEAIGRDTSLQNDSAVPAMVQILQVESPSVRFKLVEMLKSQKSHDASRRLLNRAMFDLSLDVRHSANEALRERPVGDFREELLEAFRYPWEPVAWHAAETLIHLNDQSAIPALVDLLEEPDPAAPFRENSGNVMVRELVKVNHLRNCLLCHAQSKNAKDVVTAPVPVPGQPLPQVYYSRSRRTRSIFVRADVTYLRQDFSLLHNVELRSLEKRGRWPEQQRFDYFVRTREATPKEIAAYAKKSPKEKQRYSQREAVLAALRSLTHSDPGNRSEDWQPLKHAIRSSQSDMLSQR